MGTDWDVVAGGVRSPGHSVGPWVVLRQLDMKKGARGRWGMGLRVEKTRGEEGRCFWLVEWGDSFLMIDRIGWCGILVSIVI